MYALVFSRNGLPWQRDFRLTFLHVCKTWPEPSSGYTFGVCTNFRPWKRLNSFLTTKVGMFSQAGNTLRVPRSYNIFSVSNRPENSLDLWGSGFSLRGVWCFGTILSGLLNMVWALFSSRNKDKNSLVMTIKFFDVGDFQATWTYPLPSPCLCKTSMKYFRPKECDERFVSCLVKLETIVKGTWVTGFFCLAQALGYACKWHKVVSKTYPKRFLEMRFLIAVTVITDLDLVRDLSWCLPMGGSSYKVFYSVFLLLPGELERSIPIFKAIGQRECSM